MQLPVLIEPVNNNAYRARTGEPLVLSADGATPDEAVRKLQELVGARLHAGARLVQIEVPAENPWLRGAGMFKDDPLFEQWQKDIAEYRRQVDAEPDALIPDPRSFFQEGGNPWLESFGRSADDPDFGEYVDEISRSRRLPEEPPPA